MSKDNGDRARFNKVRRKKIVQRARGRELRAELAAKAAPAPAPSRS